MYVSGPYHTDMSGTCNSVDIPEVTSRRHLRPSWVSAVTQHVL